jgi:hypothetical protein
LQAREHLVNHPNILFQEESQREDLLNEHLTQTNLIELLSELVKDHHFVITAVRSDHHDDSDLGYHCHANGFCVDCWPLESASPTDYAPAQGEKMDSFLKDVARSPVLWQIGLAGSGDTAHNQFISGPTCYSDDGGDHIHIGAKG